MTAINMFTGQYLQIATEVDRASANWRLDFRMRQRSGTTDRELFIAMQSAGDTLATRIKVYNLGDYFGVDVAQVRLNDTDTSWIYTDGVRTLNDAAFHDLSLRCNGTTVSWYIDGTQRGTSVACTQVFNNLGAFGNRNASGASDVKNDYDLEWIKLYDSTDTSSLIHHWDAASSNTSNTGAQPILVDIIAANNATGVGFPTDGTAWVDISSAPVLTSAVGTATGSTTATIGATTDEANGTMYGVVTGSATQPSVAQIKAGQDHAGAAASYASSQSISSTGAKTFSATGLTASTTYYGHIVHTDAAANDSNRLSSASFTTDAAGGSNANLLAGKLGGLLVGKL